eukprot:gene24695-biopygen17933
MRGHLPQKQQPKQETHFATGCRGGGLLLWCGNTALLGLAMGLARPSIPTRNYVQPTGRYRVFGESLLPFITFPPMRFSDWLQYNETLVGKLDNCLSSSVSFACRLSRTGGKAPLEVNWALFSLRTGVRLAARSFAWGCWVSRDPSRDPAELSFHTTTAVRLLCILLQNAFPAWAAASGEDGRACVRYAPGCLSLALVGNCISGGGGSGGFRRNAGRHMFDSLLSDEQWERAL